jgi:hypothetical protein
MDDFSMVSTLGLHSTVGHFAAQYGSAYALASHIVDNHQSIVILQRRV